MSVVCSPTIIHIRIVQGEKRLQNAADICRCVWPGNPTILTMKLWPLVSLVTLAAAQSFRGQFISIPDHFQLPDNFESKNLAQRFDVLLHRVGETSAAFRPVNTELAFEFQNLQVGEYELFVYSHDFALLADRYRVVVGDDVITAQQDNFVPSANSTSVEISSTDPLRIAVVGIKQYYESPQSKLGEMVMSSPLGVIFKNSYYTFFFTVSLVIIAFPYVIPYISPDLAELMKDMQKEMAEKK